MNLPKGVELEARKYDGEQLGRTRRGPAAQRGYARVRKRSVRSAICIMLSSSDNVYHHMHDDYDRDDDNAKQ